MLTRKQKEEIVRDISEKFSKEKIAIFAAIKNISVAKLSLFRRELKKLGAELKIAKKTFFERAIKEANMPGEPRKLEGEIGVIFGYEEQAGVAKLSQKFQKENDTFKILAGLLEKQLITREQILALAKLPGREQLLGQLAGVLVAPIRNFMNVLQGNQRNLVVVLNKIKEKR